MKSQYDPFKHHRRSIRLKDYDYGSPGIYFVTIVTAKRELLFDNQIYRRIAEANWRAIQRHFKNVTLDESIVMPNHLHGIIEITSDPGKGEAFAVSRSTENFDSLNQTNAQRDDNSANASPLQARGVQPGALGAIVGNFKSVTTRRVNNMRHATGTTIWQRNYYEHIVRNEKELNRIREYVASNPPLWEFDRENLRGQPAKNGWLADEEIWFSKSNLKFANA